MANIRLDYKNTNITKRMIQDYTKEVEKNHKELHRIALDEEDFVGWLELPTDYNKEEFKRIKKAAKKIAKESDILVVTGIGGSYLGARAVIESLTSSFYNLLPEEQRKYPQILYVGNNLSPNYINELIEYIGDKDFSVNVISKSGTTTEPAIAFRIFREILENKYGIDEARSRIYATTDKEKGALKTLAEKGNTENALYYEMCDMEEAVRNQDASHLNLEYTKDVMDIMSQLRKEWKMQYPGEKW